MVGKNTKKQLAVDGRLLTVVGRRFVNKFPIELPNSNFVDVLSLHEKPDLMKFASHKTIL
jgi:hypothetical protein